MLDFSPSHTNERVLMGYLAMQGEDGELWRWVFDGQHMREQFPQMTWE